MVQISGVISGLDTTEIIEQLMSVEEESRTKYEDKLNLYEWREEALRSIKTSLLSLKNTSGDLEDLFDYTPMAGVSSDESKITVSTSESSVTGTYSFTNVVLATTETWESSNEISNGFGDQTGSTGGLTLSNSWDTAGFANTPDGTITITENGNTTKTYTISDYATPQDLMDAVNTDFTLSLLDGGGNIVLNTGGVEYAISETGTNGFFTEAGIDFIDPNMTFDDLNAVGPPSYINSAMVSGDITINGETISIDTSTDTINSLIGKINESAADVTAYYDPVEERLVLSRTTAGDNDIIINDGITNFKGVFQLAGSSSGGQNTTFDLNGVSMERSSNTFEINGATFTLLQETDAGESITVTVDKDTESVVEDIQAWIDEYNSMMGTIKTYLTEEKVDEPTTTAELQAGILRNDSTLRTLYQTMYEMTTSSVSGLDTDSLAAVGITKESDGTLTISDSSALEDAITDDFEALSDLFTTDGATVDEKGFSRRIEELLADYTKTSTGIMDIRIDTAESGAERVEAQLERFDAKLEKIEARYWAQFTEMEEALALLEQQSSAITNLGVNWL